MQTWKAGEDVLEMVEDLIRNHHPMLLMVKDEITVLFREKAQERCGKVLLGITKKAPTNLPVLTDKKFLYKFIIEIGADTWQGLSQHQRMALLDHHLCSMRVEENAETGNVSYSIRPPDFKGYRGEVERWGMWWPIDGETLSIIEQMFGRKAIQARAEPPSRTTVTDEEDDLEADDEDTDGFDDVLEALSN